MDDVLLWLRTYSTRRVGAHGGWAGRRKARRLVEAAHNVEGVDGAPAHSAGQAGLVDIHLPLKHLDLGCLTGVGAGGALGGGFGCGQGVRNGFGHSVGVLIPRLNAALLTEELESLGDFGGDLVGPRMGL